MLKNLWQKIKQNHLLMMVLCCLIPLVLTIGLFSWIKESNYWVWLIILLCPLMHIFMTRGRKHGKACEKELDKEETVLYQCPECRLKYEEKEWVERCEAWCKKNKSCNLEITKHAIKTYE